MMGRPEPAKPFRRGPKLWLAYALYQVLFHLAVPFLFLALLLRSRKEPDHLHGLGGRFGFGPKTDSAPVWIFAASLGETRAASPLIRAILAEGHPVHLSHLSPAGLSEGRRLFAAEIAAGTVTSSYNPLDMFWAVRLFLARVKPCAGLVVEAEVWPALLFEAARTGLPMFQINGNYLETSLTRDRARFGGLRLSLFDGYTKVLTKSPEQQDRYIRAGVPKEDSHLVGELKFDQTIPQYQIDKARTFREQAFGKRPVFAIASSVAGEEEALLAIVQTLMSNDATGDDRPAVVWVPRSPQRFTAVADALRGFYPDVATRSALLADDLTATGPVDIDILVGDSMGEMNFYLALSDLTFVGATLVDHGGHSIIEPLALSKPVVTGPSTYGIAFAAAEASKAGALTVCSDAEELQDHVLDMMGNSKALAPATQAAQGFCDQHIGAAERSLKVLAPYLPARP